MFSKNKKIFGALALPAGTLGLVAVFAAAIFDPDVQPVGYVGQPTVSKSVLSSGNEKLYAGDYSSADWSGNLHSYNISSTGTIANVNDVPTDNWVGGAAAKINAQNFDTGRKIVTFNGTAGVPFRWTDIAGAQKAALDPATLATATTSDVLNYIRGDISKQANQTIPGPYRTRTNVLGDIIHSTPVHWNDGTNKTVFVGANDGMLHAINADDGTERFAYVPSMLMPRLGQLSNPAYTHKYYVDGRLDVRKFTTTSGTTTTSQTLLVGTLGAGGKGLFGLNVTDTAAASEADAASKILWEKSNASTGFANLGYTYGAPTFLTLPDGTKAVAVGNGYNNTGNGRASLFLINATTGALINEIDTGVGTLATPNGLSTPTLWDTNGDGKQDTAYAGDIDGNLWKFNLTTNTATKLHTTSPAQAITTAPGVIAHPIKGYMVNFVTGRMLTPGDKTNTGTDVDTHYAYGIWDGAPADNNTLLLQTLTERSYTSGTYSTRVRTATSNTPDWFATHKGWKTALPVAGERLVGDGALIKDSVFLFLSTNPTITPNATPPGENWWMQLDAITGGDNGTVQFDLNKDNLYNTSDEVTVGTESLKPVGRHFGGGVRSQLIQLSVGNNYVFQSNYDKNGASTGITLPADTTKTEETTTSGRGVSGGHFDEDIYYGDSLTAASPSSKVHVHEYDDKFDVTGVNMLNASNVGFNLINAIPTKTTQFKVLAQNQYLNPAVSIHIKGNPSYVYNVNAGYTPIKNFVTSATLDVTDNTQVPTYNQNTINSLAINMPPDAFAPKDWWGGALGLPADVRVGLHPTKTGCVKSAAGSNDGNMYQPVIPPATVTATGNGTLGYGAGTTAVTATGVRHNGALVIQIIKDNTPNSAIEMSVPGKPQYGWRVKSASVSTYVLAEYTTFWHHPNGICYGATGWTKLAPQDTGGSSAQTPAANSADPKVGAFGGVPVTTTPGTLTYPPISTAVNNSNGTTTTTTVTVTVTTNADGSTTTTTKTDTKTTATPGSGASNPGGGVITGGLDPLCPAGTVCTPPCPVGTVCKPPPCTTFTSGVCGPGSVIGRINWRELQR